MLDLDLCERSHWLHEPLLRPILERLHPEAGGGAIYDAAGKSVSSARLGDAFLKAAERSGPEVEPVLAYYGCLHWLKAVLHAVDPTYPPSSSVLQHGLSVRRQKRAVYRLLDEAIHVYREGVLQSACHRLHPAYHLPTRWQMGDLLGQLPGLHGVLSTIAPDRLHVEPVQMRPGPAARGPGTTADVAWVPRALAARRNMPIDAWVEEYLDRMPDSATASVGAETIDTASTQTAATAGGPPPDLSGPEGLVRIPAPNGRHPWSKQYLEREYLTNRDPDPDWCVHYAILYGLASLCRYNAREWMDILLHQNEVDATLVHAYFDAYPPRHVVDLILKCATRAIAESTQT
ncbi:YaaC family protein [Alicyclobacillus sp.]|uniref:YaaC family protein n=1 Tax=Alicyclobacillus sp. TaxID=61169 RepID=UPI0025C35D20|nr:YaaC family protein [Alicyclobacillus sp.]MCL6517924.1 YaaC family protein [Alicyclobacillus sp.]